ncbi:WD40/YVTN/BNR-like repeat-containing protein [Hyalangium minutum]|uniref:Uncharacterized protein n=1 Tax=Hyalangium minutum TaxID=394096 RepID=A0A085W018_9BACT|nr:hypothetical protein [Hyalangium minutum]KFE61031.1 hypothetical protein DB31_4466 [Hyalangium minutum]
MRHRGWLLLACLWMGGWACKPTPEDPPDPPVPDAGVDPTTPPVGTVLAEASGVIGDAPLELVIGSARVLIPAHAARDGLRVTARLLTNVPARYGGDPVDGLVVQLLPGGQPLNQAATLIMPYAAPTGGARYRAMYSSEAGTSWGLQGDLSGSAGNWSLPVPFFNLWAATLAGGGPPGPLFDGIASATTNTTEGGIDVTEGAFTSRAVTQIYLEPFYKVYVSETPGGQNFERAWVMGRGIVRVTGLTPGRTWCLVMRVVDRDGIEDQNTVERCAVAGAPPPPGLALTRAEPFTGPNISRQFLGSGALLRASVGAGGFRVDLERSEDGATWNVVDSLFAPQATDELEFRDYVRTPRTFQYRLRAWYGPEDKGATAAVTVAVPARQSVWRTPLEWQGESFIRLPGLRLDRQGRLLLQGWRMRDPISTADLTNPWIVSESHTPGPDLFDPGEPALFWGRVRCGLAPWLVPGAGGTGLSDAVRAADGTVYVVDSGTGVLMKLAPGGGCAEVINTRMAGSVIDLAAHPTDPLKLAAVSTHGIFVSSDGGATLVRQGNGWPWASSLNQRVYSPAGGVTYGPGGVLYALYRNQVQTSADHVNFTDSGYLSQNGGQALSMAVASDGRLAIGLAMPDGLGRIDLGTPSAMVSEPLTFPPFSLLWLPDGRLLAHQEVSVLTIDSGKVLFEVRAPGGGWMQSLVASVAEQGRRVIFDPRPGHEGELYAGGLRSRDGGQSWQRIPAGPVLAHTISGSELALFFSCVDPVSPTQAYLCRSIDGGDTVTLLPVLLAGPIFNPALPAQGVILPRLRTSDAGATWTSMSGTLPTSLTEIGLAGAVWYAVGTVDWGYTSADQGLSWQQFPPGLSVVAGDGDRVLVIQRNGAFVVYTGSSATPVNPTPAVVGSKKKILVSRGFGLNSGTVYLKTSDSTGIGFWKSTSGAAGPYTLLTVLGTDYDFFNDPFDTTGNRLSIGPYYSFTGGQ